MALRLREYRHGGEILPYAVALTRDEAREALGSRTDESFRWVISLLADAGLFLPAADRDEVWVRLPRGGRRRLYLFALPGKAEVGLAANAARWDARARGDAGPAPGSRVSVILA